MWKKILKNHNSSFHMKKMVCCGLSETAFTYFKPTITVLVSVDSYSPVMSAHYSQDVNFENFLAYARTIPKMWEATSLHPHFRESYKMLH